MEEERRREKEMAIEAKRQEQAEAKRVRDQA
jgi:hypothetical protein